MCVCVCVCVCVRACVRECYERVFTISDENSVSTYATPLGLYLGSTTDRRGLQKCSLHFIHCYSGLCNDIECSHLQDEARVMRNYLVTKQTAKKGKRRERKMKRALTTIKVRSLLGCTHKRTGYMSWLC